MKIRQKQLSARKKHKVKYTYMNPKTHREEVCVAYTSQKAVLSKQRHPREKREDSLEFMQDQYQNQSDFVNMEHIQLPIKVLKTRSILTNINHKGETQRAVTKKKTESVKKSSLKFTNIEEKYDQTKESQSSRIFAF